MKQAVAKRKERIFSKDFTLVMTAGTGTAFMNHLFAVALALHIEAIGGLQLHVGILGMVYSLVALVIRPMSGVLSDKYGRVKQLIVGAFLCTVGTFLYGTTALVSLLIVFRAIQGIGFGMHSTMAGAVAADVLPKSRLAEGIGIFGLGATIAMAVGPGLGIFVMGEGELHNFRNLFFLAAGMCAVSTIANSFISYERKRKKAARTASLQAGASGQSKAAATTTSSVPDEPLPKTFLGFEYAVFKPIAAMTLIFMGMAGKTLFLPAYAISTGIGNPSLYFIFSAAGVFVSRMLMGKVVDRRGSDFVLIPGLIALIAGYIILPFLTTLPALVALGFPLGLAQGAVNPTFNSLIFKRCSAARRGTASGAFFTSIDIGFAVGSLLHGALIDVFDFRFVFWAGAVLMALGLLVYIFFASDKRYNAKLRG